MPPVSVSDACAHDLRVPRAAHAPLPPGPAGGPPLARLRGALAALCRKARRAALALQEPRFAALRESE